MNAAGGTHLNQLQRRLKTCPEKGNVDNQGGKADVPGERARKNRRSGESARREEETITPQENSGGEKKPKEGGGDEERMPASPGGEDRGKERPPTVTSKISSSLNLKAR